MEQNNIMNALQTQMDMGTFGGQNVTDYASGMYNFVERNTE